VSTKKFHMDVESEKCFGRIIPHMPICVRQSSVAGK
jgi:hypothetical protein